MLKWLANTYEVSLPFSAPVLKELRIKGDRPGEEIDPANHLISVSHYDAMNHLKLNPRSDGKCKENELICTFNNSHFFQEILQCSALRKQSRC